MKKDAVDKYIDKVKMLKEIGSELKNGMELIMMDIKELRDAVNELHKRLDNHINRKD